MFEIYPPSNILQPFIAFFYNLKCHKVDYANIISEFCVPSGFGHMGFHLRGSFYMIQKNQRRELQRFYTTGQQTHHYFFNSDSDKVDLYGVTFKPTGLWHLFGVDMQTITDKSIETNFLLKDNIQSFIEQFDSEQEFSTRVQLIEDLLIFAFLKAQPQLNLVDSAIQKINQTYGCVSIKELAYNLGISKRYFQKKFKRMVGITPTSYRRIVRFNFMFADIKTDVPIDCNTLSALYNYHDLSHFSKDFKRYCGICPSKFHISKFNFLQELIALKVMHTTYL
jgi:AraC-like DNA-binding protein